MHYIVDPGPLPTTEGITFQGPTIGAPKYGPYPVVRPATTGYAWNRSGYQPPESVEQFVSGDNRPIIGERTVDIIIEGTSIANAHHELSVLSGALRLAGTVTIEYAGVRVTAAGTRGITSWQPIGNGSSIRATVAYYPRLQGGELIDSPSDSVLGPI